MISYEVHFSSEMIKETFCLKFHKGLTMCLWVIIEDEVVNLLFSTEEWLLCKVTVGTLFGEFRCDLRKKNTVKFTFCQIVSPVHCPTF